jgi:hypothetical protein
MLLVYLGERWKYRAGKKKPIIERITGFKEVRMFSGSMLSDKTLHLAFTFEVVQPVGKVIDD